MTLFGPDGSHHQDPAHPTSPFTVGDADWGRIDFLIWRCSIRNIEDRTFAWALDNARKRNVPFKGYHFIYPTDTGEWPAKKQAAACLAALGGDTSIPVMLDWESDVWKKNGKVFREFFPTFDDVLAVAAEMRKLGISVVSVYTGEAYWKSKGSPTMSGHGLDLVNARWGKNVNAAAAADRYGVMGGDAGSGWQGYGGLTPTIWQFGSGIRWGTRNMDHNACRSGAADIARLFKLWSGPAPSKPVPPVGHRVPIDWGAGAPALAAVTACPSTDDVLAGKVDTWWAIWATKTIQRAAGLPATGRWDQKTAEASTRIE